MALYLHLDKAGDVVSVGPLPLTAYRLDTGERVDPALWMDACRFYDVETVTLDDVPAGLTKEQKQAITVEVTAARARLEARRHWLADTEQAWAVAKGTGQDYLDNIPPWPTGVASLAVHGQQIAYLRQALGDVMRWVVGGGTITTPGLGDVLKIAVEVLNDLIQDADRVEPPAE